MSSEVSSAIRGAIDGMLEAGPDDLLGTVNFKLRRTGLQLTEDQLISIVASPDANDVTRRAMHLALARWDAVQAPGWGDGSPEMSPERREVVLSSLALSNSARATIDDVFPSVARRDIVIASPGPWDPWYTEERKRRHDFYWNAYRGVLESKGWDPYAIAHLDESTSGIVGRLADPAAPLSYQSKGLVVGHVQSGKTANFTGIVAKAIDAGYRLVIVLTGMHEILRSQTQRRLDMELVGEENILGGRDRNDADAVRDVDYIGTEDEDWYSDRFLKHGVSVIDLDDVPSIKRLTTLAGDYKALKAGLGALDFRSTGELRDRRKPLHDPSNLFGSDVRLAIVKKNKSVLEKLLRDLQDLHADLREIPVLIIDDEADQASVNTTNPKRSKHGQDEKDRTAINKLISELLTKLPRAQYVGYTATPFANVFISPDDSGDIFPKDFIISLDPAPDYMGGRAFHDLDWLPEDEPIDASNSNEKAFVRSLYQGDDSTERAEMARAIDSFVLSGAIKLWRMSNDSTLRFRHHTMLVHETVKQDDHLQLAQRIRSVWAEAGYSTARGLARLKEMYFDDFVEVHNSRAWGTAMPPDFETLVGHIGRAVDKITVALDPVVIVNGSKDSDYKQTDFQSGDYWRIMVGGAKLSRGFTVEGLTTTYYRRRAMAADTLMQMGRWFGYRPGYPDLVRLYIARDIDGPHNKTYDLYDAFTAIIQDEEDFRSQLQKFSKLEENGRPSVLPIDVPPMVFQQLPWLKPTGTAKMYNAVLTAQGDGGALRDFPRQADRGEGESNARHFAAVRSWVEKLGQPLTFNYEEKSGVTKEFDGRVAIVSANEVCEKLAEFTWTDNYTFSPTLRFMRDAIAKGELTDWAILVPKLSGVPELEVDGLTVPLLKRTRRDESRGGFSGSSFRQRAAIERIAGNSEAPGGPEAARLYTATRGALLLTFAADPASSHPEDRDPKNWTGAIDPKDVATLFSLAVPYRSAPRGRIGFKVRDSSNKPIINV